MILHLHNLSRLPPVLDFEASSLSDCSYPISAGLRVGNCLKYWLIKPQADWIDWSLASQAIHGLKRSYIEDNGVDAAQVYLEMCEALAGFEAIYSDNPYWERKWLSCLGKFNQEIRDVTELIPPYKKPLFKESLESVFHAHKLIPHRSDHDALALSLAVYDLQNG